MAYDMLCGCKNTATLAMEALMESASSRCREIFHRIHDDELRAQWQLFELLHRKGEYELHPADRRMVESVRQRMEHLRRTHAQMAAVGASASSQQDGSGYPSSYNGSGRWSERNWTEPAGVGAGNPFGGYAAGNVAFEPDRGMPQGTHFESERAWESGSRTADEARYGGAYEGGRTYAPGGVNTTGTQATGAGYTGRSGWNGGQASRTGGTNWSQPDAGQRASTEGGWNAPRRY